MSPEHHDVVVVGGGSAGCVVASGLSEDPARRVLLLEAGPDPWPVPELIASGGRPTSQLLESDYIERIPSPRSADGSSFDSLAGRIIGGGSSVNFMDVLRPLRHDFDTWVARGNDEWSYAALLPIMRSLEADQDFPDPALHGRTGRLHVQRPFALDRPVSPLAAAFMERALAMSLPHCADMNGPDPLGISVSPANVKAGRRQSSAVAFLDPARRRPNLAILADAHVRSLRLVGPRVEAIEYVQQGRLHVVKADTVVLCAGVFHSPQILMHSGVGSAQELARLGIGLRERLDGVGANYQDHAVAVMTFAGVPKFQEEWSVPRLRLLLKSRPDLPCANVHVIPRPPLELPNGGSVMPVSVHLLQQRNRGRVGLRSGDPRDNVMVDARMLEHPDDVDALTAAMRFVADFFRGDPMNDYYGRLMEPEPDGDWGRFVRAEHDSYHHGVGTCAMGPASDSMAVVDQGLRVHGIDNLWVADASVLPTIPHASTNLAAMLVGQVAVHSVRVAG
jgi:choline dehydrogenase